MAPGAAVRAPVVQAPVVPDPASAPVLPTPELSHRLEAPLESGELIINMRAEDDPEQLWARTRVALDAVAAEFSATVVIEQHEFFRPAKPNPTHRMALA